MKRIANGMAEHYQYDNCNRLISKTKDDNTIHYEYDLTGNLLKDEQGIYTYNAFRQTTKVERFDGNVQINHYDAEGLRSEMEENGELVAFIFNQQKNVITEQNTKGINRYILGQALIAKNTDFDRTYYHYASDEMGSITHIIDEAGCIRNRYQYDAWGQVIEKEEQMENRFLFTGQQFDPITQQYYLRARFYNPAITRFTQEDTYRGAGLNLYAYCQNNPVYYVDPTGNVQEEHTPAELKQYIDDLTKKGGLSESQIIELAQKKYLNSKTKKLISAVNNSNLPPQDKQKLIDMIKNDPKCREAMAEGLVALDAYDNKTRCAGKNATIASTKNGENGHTLVINGISKNRVNNKVLKPYRKEFEVVKEELMKKMIKVAEHISDELLTQGASQIQGKIGRVSHAEIQSFIYEVVQEIMKNKALSGTATVSNMEKVISKMEKIAIGVSRGSCQSCQIFFKAISKKFKIKIFIASGEQLFIFDNGNEYFVSENEVTKNVIKKQ